MVPSTDFRKLLASLPACCIGACAVIYIETYFSSLDKDPDFFWILPMGIGLFLFGIHIRILESSASTKQGLTWRGLTQNTPSGILAIVYVVWGVALANLIWFAAHSGWGAPSIIDRQYVIEARGRILRTLSRPEYLVLRRSEARMFSTVMICLYFGPLTYWSFWRRNRVD